MRARRFTPRLPALRVLFIRAGRPPHRVEGILEEAGVAVEATHIDARRAPDVWRPDLNVVLLDLDPPEPQRLDLLSRWRKAGVAVPVLAVAEPRHLVRCLDSGADDCVSGAVAPEELLARLRALARRHSPRGPTIEAHDLVIDTQTRQVRRAGRAIALTPREYDVLKLLACHRGRVVSRTLIWEQLYGEQDPGTSNVVNVYIRYLRNKIDRDFDLPLILTHWGEGYMLRCDGDSTAAAELPR